MRADSQIQQQVSGVLNVATVERREIGKIPMMADLPSTDEPRYRYIMTSLGAPLGLKYFKVI